MWKKGKTKIIQNSIVTYKHAHTQTHTHTETLSPEYYAMSISLAPPTRHALCALSTLSVL